MVLWSLVVLLLTALSACTTGAQTNASPTAVTAAALTPTPAVASTAAAPSAKAASIATSPPAPAPRLTGVPWRLLEINAAGGMLAIDASQDYVLTFRDDGALDIKADCVTTRGTYAVDGTNISIKLDAAAGDACPQGSRATQFLRSLADSASFLALQRSLILNQKTAGDSLLLLAAPLTTANLCGEKALAVRAIDASLDPKIVAGLDEVLVAFLRDTSRLSPGVSMLILTPQGRYYKSAGVADVATCQPLAADAPFQIGSNTKLMTAAMIFQLQEEGALSTADPLARWLPDLAAHLPNGDKITIDMLLTHTAGLYDYFDVVAADGAIADGTTKKAMLTRAFTPLELVNRVADSGQSYFKPGAEGGWKYSNTGYILLGLIIEKATGKSYAENLQTRIFEPLGLKKTYLLPGQPAPGALPQGYFSSPFQYTTGEWNASQGWAAGAVVSTAEEFAAFLKALFTGKLFRDPATLARMQASPPAGTDALGPGATYAHGMLNNNGVLGHGGQTLGFQSDGGYIPGKDVTIVMWANSAESGVQRPLVPEIARLVGALEPKP